MRVDHGCPLENKWRFLTLKNRSSPSKNSATTSLIQRIRLVERRPLGLLLSAILVKTGKNFAMIFLLSPLPVRTSLPYLLRTV